MRDDKLNKYKYFINKLGAKYLKEDYGFDDEEEVNVSDQIMSDISSGDMEAAQEKLLKIKGSDKQAYKEATEDLISDYKAGRNKNMIKAFFYQYYTETDTRVLTKMKQTFQDIEQETPGFIASQIGKFFAEWDGLERYEDQGNLFDTYLGNTISGNLMDVRKSKKKELNTTSMDQKLGDDENSGTLGDKIADTSSEEEAAKDVLELLTVDENGEITLTNPVEDRIDTVGSIAFDGGEPSEIKNYSIDIDKDKVSQVFSNLDNEAAVEYVYSQITDGSAKRYIIQNFLDVSNEDNDISPETLDMDVLRAEEAVKFYDAIKLVQKNALKHLQNVQSLKFRKDPSRRAGELSFYEDFYMENWDIEQMFEDLGNSITKYGLQRNMNKPAKLAISDYIQSKYKKFNASEILRKGKKWGPVKWIDQPTAIKQLKEVTYPFISKWIESIPTTPEDYESYLNSGSQAYQGIISNSAEGQELKNDLNQKVRMLKDGKQVPEVGQFADYFKTAYDLVTNTKNGELNGKSIEDISENPVVGKAILDLIHDDKKSEVYNSLNLTNQNKSSDDPNRYKEEWVSRNKDVINKLIPQSVWDKIDQLGQKRNLPEDATDEEIAFQNAKAAVNFKMPDPFKQTKTMKTGYAVDDEAIFQKYFGKDRDPKYAEMSRDEINKLYQKDLEDLKLKLVNKDRKSKNSTGLPLMREMKEMIEENNKLLGDIRRDV